MRLDQALQKIDVEVVKVDNHPNQLTLLLRVHRKDPINHKRWVFAATKLVMAAAKSARAGTWGADVSKALMPRNGTAVFFWRVVLTGNTKTGQRIFGEAVLEGLRQGREITTFPLVGQVQYKRDPANGKFKGGHSLGSADGIIASQFMPR